MKNVYSSVTRVTRTFELLGASENELNGKRIYFESTVQGTERDLVVQFMPVILEDGKVTITCELNPGFEDIFFGKVCGKITLYVTLDSKHRNANR